MYAVVQFLNESTSQDLSVSEVPKAWIIEDGKQCWWPPAHSGIYIARRKEPNPDSWKLYDIKVECYCASYQEAKQKAARICSTSDEDGVRQPKPNKKYNPDQYDLDICENNCYRELPSPPTLTEDFHERVVNAFTSHSNRSEDSPESTCSSSGYSEPRICDISTHNVANVHVEPMGLPASAVEIPARHLNLPAKTVELPVKPVELLVSVELPERPVKLPIATLPEMPVGTVEPASGSTHNCCRNFDILIELISELNLNVRDLKETLYNKKTFVTNEDTDVISSKLPLQSIEEMVQLENFIQNKKQNDALIYILFSIGGLSGKDFTQRVLRKLMTNDLAELCSWTGAKHNFELQKLILMDCAYSAIIRQFQISKKEFEMHIKDWLRHAKQRRERTQKK